jgi:DMSO/TMAO reductase YedYZ molybdopterin-dependent catalytic subunit
MISRRKLLKDLIACASGWNVPFLCVCRLVFPRLHTADSRREGTLLGVLPFFDEGGAPLSTPLGAELDGRLFTDLSKVKPENPIVSNAEFYVRTRASKLLDMTRSWSIEIRASSEDSLSFLAGDLEKRSRPMGIHLMECAGNSRSAHFGMLSVADWDGLPVGEVLERVEVKKLGTRIRISGFDRYLTESRSSTPGASWIFTLDQLISSRAFLATKMNGQPLTIDHGAPVRLVVPSWYGCACIKWVNEIAFVADDVAATSQMQEYAGRTNQDGVPTLATEYRPALITYGALPVRVEKWSLDSKLRFRVAGIHWGGTRPIEGLEIRFNPGEDFVPVGYCEKSSGDSWGFWSHDWVPTKVAKYTIRLRLNDRSLSARRLDSGYYERSVEIKEIA